MSYFYKYQIISLQPLSTKEPVFVIKKQWWFWGVYFNFYENKFDYYPGVTLSWCLDFASLYTRGNLKEVILKVKELESGKPRFNAKVVDNTELERELL